MEQHHDRDWPYSTGEMADRIRTFRWDGTPLGPIAAWSPHLKSAVDMMLPCGFPMIILWGPELIQLYNDEYRILMGRKHPSGLGQPTRECWPEVWHINQPIYGRVWTGQTLTFEDAVYPLDRSGVIEDAWLTLTYSPLRETEGEIAGTLVTIFETTGRKLAERRREQVEETLRASERRQSYLLALADALRPLMGPLEVQMTAARMLGQHLGANRVAYAEDCGDGETVVLARNYTDGVPGIEGTYRYTDYGEELLREMRAGRAVVRPDIAKDPSLTSAEKKAHADLQLGATLNIPLVKDGRLVAILAVHYARAHEFGAEELFLARETAERTWGAVELARAQMALRESEEQLKVMVDELKHRTRNLLTVIQSVAYQTARTSTGLADFVDRFAERLSALGKVQDILSKSDDTEITLHSLVWAELEAMGSSERDDRVKITGTFMRLKNSAVQTLALAIHELATNARKYGALADDAGRLSVSWAVEDKGNGSPQLRLEWLESHLRSPPAADAKIGYGRYLVERAMPLAFGGTTDYAITPDGLRCVFSIPLAKVLKSKTLKHV